MAKKRKVVKRVYEKGRETTVPIRKKTGLDKKRFKRAKITSAQDIDKKSAVPMKLDSESVSLSRPHVQPSQRMVDQILRVSPVRKDSPTRYSFDDNRDLPGDYGTTRVTLMVKDPFHLYVYWEISHESIAFVKREQGDNGSIVLRLYDVTLINFDGMNANNFFDIEVGSLTGNWYQNLWKDNMSFVGEIGYRMYDGRFFSLARSNFVNTPSMSNSPRYDQMWMRVTDSISERPYVDATIQIMEKARHTFIKDAKKKNQEAAVKTAEKRTKRVFLSEEEIRNYYAGLSPLLKDVISDRISSESGTKIHGYALLVDGQEDVRDIKDVEKRQELLSRVPTSQILKRIMVGASEELVLVGGSENHAVTSKGASDFVAQKMKAKTFFFELNAELIVYGRTEPDATVWLGDRKIPLRSDGTFSLRFALPDGNMPLPFTAISNDKTEKRKISTTVDRKTVVG